MTRLLTVLAIALSTTAAHAGLIASERYAKTEPPPLPADFWISPALAPWVAAAPDAGAPVSASSMPGPEGATVRVRPMPGNLPRRQ